LTNPNEPDISVVTWLISDVNEQTVILFYSVNVIY